MAAPSPYKANVWVHFGLRNKPGSKEQDKENAICKLCHAAVKYSGNTTNLRTYLIRQHADPITLQSQPKPVNLRQTVLDNTSNRLSTTSSLAQKIKIWCILFVMICAPIVLSKILQGPKKKNTRRRQDREPKKTPKTFNDKLKSEK